MYKSDWYLEIFLSLWAWGLSAIIVDQLRIYLVTNSSLYKQAANTFNKFKHHICEIIIVFVYW